MNQFHQDRKRTGLGIVALFCFIALLASCNSVPPPPEKSSIIGTDQKGFSPLSDRSKRDIGFEIDIGEIAALKAWTISIVGGGEEVWTKTGTAEDAPSFLSWDGSAKSGNRAADGRYAAVMRLDYGKKFSAETVESSSFILVAESPRIGLVIDPAMAIPQGTRFTAPVSLKVAAESGLAGIASWSLDVKDGSGRSIRTFSADWPESSVSWDGVGAGGETPEPETSYSLALAVWDEFGNKAVEEFSLPVGGPAAAPEKSAVSPRRESFSPTVADAKRSLELDLVVGNRSSARAWRLTIADSSGKAVRAYEGKTGAVPASVPWDGKDGAGKALPDGEYEATLEIDYGATFKPATARSGAFSIVTAPPEGAVTATPERTSLEAIRAGASISIAIEAASRANLGTWTLDVIGADGKVFKSFAGTFPGGKISWNGKGDDGSLPEPDTVYTLAATVKDKPGNTSALEGKLAVSALPDAPERSSLSARARGFSPNGDKVSDSMLFDASAGSTAAAESWKVVIASEGGAAVRTLSGAMKDLAGPGAWNGRDDAGQLCADGRYRAALTVGYGKKYGAATASSSSFLLVTSAPKVSCAVSPKFFSPDGDGTDDELEIRIDASNGPAAMDSWTARILDQGGSPFAERAGRWPEASFSWDGRGKDGSLVESASDYRAEITARDEFGNTGKAQAVARVDILVTETATGYKIRVPSVVFKAYTADYLDVPAESRERNLESLDNLAAKLDKFPGYRILIVGHASMVYWYDPVKGKAEQEKVLIPLSKARSAAIKKALVERGIEAARIETDGTGAEDPVVPDSDAKNRWKNRRVEFFLNK